MAGYVYLIREDQPLGNAPDELGCWKLDIPDGSTWGDVAINFANDRGFPVGAIASIVDASVSGAVQTFKLEQQWVPYTG